MKTNKISKILHTSTVKPKYHYETAEIIESADKHWLRYLDPSLRRAALKVFEGAEIKSRSSVAPLDVVFGNATFEEKNNLYKAAMIDLGEKVLRQAIERTGIDPKSIDYIITTSCTGFMIPSVDAYLVERVGLRQDIRRLPVTEMGCAGGTSALIYASDFAKAHPDKIVAILALETPSLTFQKNDVSMENFVSTAIFADGAACVIMGPSTKMLPSIVDSAMYHFPESTHLMGYNLQNTGLKIVLDRDVPDEIGKHFKNIVLPFLERNHLKPEDIGSYLFHPGGKKIIHMVEDYIGRFNKDISESKDVLKNRGNMSSATILHILESVMSRPHHANEKGYMLAFGPGFMAQSLLLNWSAE